MPRHQTPVMILLLFLPRVQAGSGGLNSGGLIIIIHAQAHSLAPTAVHFIFRRSPDCGHRRGRLLHNESYPDWNSNSSILFSYNLDVNNDSNDTEKTLLRFSFALPGNVNVISAKVRMRVLLPPVFSVHVPIISTV